MSRLPNVNSDRDQWGNILNDFLLQGHDADGRLSPSGTTGATAASRYMGATTSGAPTTGTFQVGDFVIDLTGGIWICSEAGTPGVWNNPAWGLAPIVAKKSDASLVLTVAASSAFSDSDAGGSAAARPMDLVVPNCRAGQWVTLSINAYASTGTAGVYVDFFTVVAGAVVNKIGPATTGIGGWLIPANVDRNLAASASYQIQANDIENGAVRFRLRHAGSPTGGTAHTLYGAFNTELRFEAHGPKG